MFGLIKKIFKKDAVESTATAPLPQTPPTFARTATPSHHGRPPVTSNPFSNLGGGSGTPLAPALDATAEVRPPTRPASGELPDVVSLPLATVLKGLSPDLQILFPPRPKANLEIEFGLQGILPQLSSGRVRVGFGELRAACPDGIYKGSAEHDGKLIELPLSSILSRLNPALLPRRTQRQLMDVPKDVTGLFGSLGEPMISAAPVATASPAIARDEPPAAKPPAGSSRSGAVPEDLENIPSPFGFGDGAPVPASPAAASDSPSTAHTRRSAVPQDLDRIPSPFGLPIPTPNSAQSEKAAKPSTIPPARPSRPEPRPEPQPEPTEMPRIKLDPALSAAISASAKAATPPQPARPAVPPPPQSSTAQRSAAKLQEVRDDNFLTIPLRDVIEGWPEAVLAEIHDNGKLNANLILPAGEIDLSIRKGKVTFTWGTLRGWLQPASDGTSPNDDVELQLPLKVVAPKFLSLRKPKAKQTKAHVEESIPDLFSGGPAHAVEPQVETAKGEPPGPAPVASPPELPASSPVPVAPATDQPVRTPTARPAVPAGTRAPAPQPASSQPAAPATRRGSSQISAANPNELVSKTASLPGVSGALLAMNDGLVVASNLAKPLKGEAVAAFLPQIFGRLTQFSSELKLGDLSTVMLVMENCPWIIFRTGKVFFAVVGTTGEALPLPQLTAIVADIKRQNL